MNNTTELRVEEDGIHLKREGREHATKVLAEALDTTLLNTWTPNASSRTRTAKGEANSDNKDTTDTSKTASTRTPKQNRTPKDVVEWVTKWKALNLKVDGHSAIKDVKLAEKGIFGLWAIRRAMGDAGKVISRAKLASFLYEAFEVKVDDRGLEAALKNKVVQDKVLPVSGTMFQILPPGIEYAMKLSGLTDEAP